MSSVSGVASLSHTRTHRNGAWCLPLFFFCLCGFPWYPRKLTGGKMEVGCLCFLSCYFVLLLTPQCECVFIASSCRPSLSDQACVLARPHLSAALSIQYDYRWPTLPPVSGAHMNQYFLRGRKCSLPTGQCHTTNTVQTQKCGFDRKIHMWTYFPAMYFDLVTLTPRNQFIRIERDKWNPFQQHIVTTK